MTKNKEEGSVIREFHLNNPLLWITSILHVYISHSPFCQAIDSAIQTLVRVLVFVILPTFFQAVNSAIKTIVSVHVFVILPTFFQAVERRIKTIVSVKSSYSFQAVNSAFRTIVSVCLCKSLFFLSGCRYCSKNIRHCISVCLSPYFSFRLLKVPERLVVFQPR